jgi:hypothetical protein
MAETVFRGPGAVLGSLMDGRVESFDGPSLGYQGDVILNPIFSPQPKDGLSPGRMHGWYNAFYTVSTDAIPSATNSTIIAAAQAPSTTAGLAINLVTVTAGTAAGVTVFAPGIPIQPMGTNQIVTVAAIDFGFTTVGMTAASTTLNAVDNRFFTVGQWLVIPGAGGGTTTPLFTQVTAISSTSGTALTVSPAPQTTATNVPVGQANLYSNFVPSGTQFGPGPPVPNAYEPYRLAGLAAGLDPAQSVTRALTVTAASIGSGTTSFLVTGYDIYGQKMAELIAANGTNVVSGKKAFKYILNVAVQTAGTTVTPANVSIGLGDVIGMNTRSDRWEFSDIFYNGGFSINSQGWTAAVTTIATNTTGDVRGAVNASTLLVGASSGSATAGGTLDGVKRVTIFQNVQFLNAISATPVNYTSVIGVAQATA